MLDVGLYSIYIYIYFKAPFHHPIHPCESTARSSFIHQAEVEVLILHHLVWVDRQIVSEVVKAQLSVGQVYHITLVGLLSVCHLGYRGSADCETFGSESGRN